MFVAGLGDITDDINIANFPLIDAHTSGGVALYMLNRVKAFAHGKADIIQCNIILNVNKRLVAGLNAVNMPEWLEVIIG